MKNKFKSLLVDNDNSAVKAAVYYLICQIIVQGMAFLTTPIFSRIMTKTEYGTVSNFLAWEALLFPFLTLNLRAAINKSKYDISDDNDSFLFTILVTSHFIIILVCVIIEINRNLFYSFFELDIHFVRLLLIYILFYTAFDFQQIQYNIYRKYKLYVLYSIATSFFSLLMSIILVLLMDDKVEGRLLGIVLPAILIDSIICINIWKKGKKFNFKYVKYALSISVPLLPSALSATILSSSDRIVITQCCGTDQTALYSIPYAVSSMASIIWMALNQAWGPWLLDNLQVEAFDKVKKASKSISALYVCVIIGIMLIAPEILWVLGGNEYMSTISAMPPVILAMVCQFFYTFYFNVEYFYGETYIISLGTLLAAIVNLITNYIFIPRYGYIAAAYTTLAGYGIMLLYHYLIVRFKLKKDFIYNNLFFCILLVGLLILQVGISFLYNLKMIRYAIIVVYLIILICVLVNNRKQVKVVLLGILKKSN